MKLRFCKKRLVGRHGKTQVENQQSLADWIHALSLTEQEINNLKSKKYKDVS